MENRGCATGSYSVHLCPLRAISGLFTWNHNPDLSAIRIYSLISIAVDLGYQHSKPLLYALSCFNNGNVLVAFPEFARLPHLRLIWIRLGSSPSCLLRRREEWYIYERQYEAHILSLRSFSLLLILTNFATLFLIVSREEAKALYGRCLLGG